MHTRTLFASVSMALLALLVAPAGANNAVTAPSGGGGRPAPVGGGGAYDSMPSSSDSCQVLACTNSVRGRNGRGPLQGSAKLDAAACQIAADMARVNTLSHTAGGTTLTQRMRSNGYNYNSCAENILYFGPYNGATKACYNWEMSLGHKKNMLGDYTHHGSCFKIRGNRKWYAQVFGRGDHVKQYMCGAGTSPITANNNNAPVSTPAGGNYGNKQAPSPGAGTNSNNNNAPASTPAGGSYGNKGASPGAGTNGNGAKAPQKFGPNGLPCIATGYGNKSAGAGNTALTKRGLQQSPRTGVMAAVVGQEAANSVVVVG